MKKHTRSCLVLVLFAALLLAGCGSGETAVDPAAADARNSQRANAAQGAAPTPGQTAGATGGK